MGLDRGGGQARVCPREDGNHSYRCGVVQPFLALARDSWEEYVHNVPSAT